MRHVFMLVDCRYNNNLMKRYAQLKINAAKARNRIKKLHIVHAHNVRAAPQEQRYFFYSYFSTFSF